MYEKLFESTKLVRPAQTGDSWQYFCYQATWDAFLGQSYNEWARVFRDGTKVKFGLVSGGYVMLGRARGFPAYWNQWSQKLYPAFDLNGLPNPNEVLNPNWNIGYGMGPSYYVARFVDDIKQIYLDQPNANRIDIYHLEDGQKIGEIVHKLGEYFSTLAWVQHGQVAGLCRTSGKVRIMNYLEPVKVVESGRIDPFRVATYDCQHHNFVAIGTDGKVRVYSREAWPAVLSAPTFEPAVVYGLKANKVKTRLTGHEGEPCKDWWVHWELEGVNGPVIGSLDKAVSKTDEDGYAENFYFGPDEGLTGQNKLTVRVVLY